MELRRFRIKNFRSISDTQWCSVSPDGVTCLIGQNEAGKSSILDAIEAFETEDISEDDRRFDSANEPLLPQVYLEFSVDKDFTKELLEKYILSDVLKEFLSGENKNIQLRASWEEGSEDQKLELLTEALLVDGAFDVIPDEPSSAGAVGKETLDEKKLLKHVYDHRPLIVKFDNVSSILPSSIKLSDLVAKNEKVKGYQGALNFLSVADLEISSLQQSSDLRHKKYN